MIQNSSLRAFSFRFQAENMQGQSVFGNPRQTSQKSSGRSRLELAVIFLHDDPERYAIGYALWTRKGRLCHGGLCRSPRQHAALRNAGNPKDNRAPEGDHGG